jgi:hypothetical protein
MLMNRNKKEKRDRKKAHERVKYDYMTTELKEAIRKGTEGSLKVGKSGADGKMTFEISLKSRIANPAFIMSAAVFGTQPLKPDDIDFSPAPASELHPAVARYDTCVGNFSYRWKRTKLMQLFLR